jgi:hypothetical protein
LAVLAKIGTESENVVSAFLHFPSPGGTENSRASCPAGNAEYFGVFLVFANSSYGKEAIVTSRGFSVFFIGTFNGSSFFGLPRYSAVSYIRIFLHRYSDTHPAASASNAYLVNFVGPFMIPDFLRELFRCRKNRLARDEYHGPVIS